MTGAPPTDAPEPLEAQLRAEGFERIAGTDEAGRGCLAGPVVAAAVTLPPGPLPSALAGLTDSKALSRARREALTEAIQEETARADEVGVGTGRCSPAEIDEHNILHAALEAMRRATKALADQLSRPPGFLLVDGDKKPTGLPCPARAVVKGDRHVHSVAAASIIAKTTRDAVMRRLHADFPGYGWDTNVGYPTAAHYDGLAKRGPTPHHRRSFRLRRMADG
jgi:ribonuclease HII